MMPKEAVDTSSFEYKDMFGRDIKVGDYIVYGAVDGRSGTLRAGRVLELTYGSVGYKCGPKVKVDTWSNFRAQGWNGETKSGKQSKAVSLGFLDRLVVVDPSTVSDKIKQDLAGPATNYWGDPV
jgi:hypothetical protein